MAGRLKSTRQVETIIKKGARWEKFGGEKRGGITSAAFYISFKQHSNFENIISLIIYFKYNLF